MAGQVLFHVSLVVLVIDDFTGKPITGDKVCVFIEGQKPPIAKEGGYYIFVNVHEKKVTLTCKSNLYQQRTQEINLAQRDEMEAFIVRLLPAAGYPIPVGATCVTGQTSAGKKLLFWNEEDKRYRLLSDYSANDEMIDIYAPNPKELVGKTVLICHKKSNEKQYFRIIGKAKQQYRMDQKLPVDYKKTETLVVPVYEIAADENGGFFFMMPKEQGNDVKIFCLAEKETARLVDVKAGKRNVISI